MSEIIEEYGATIALGDFGTSYPVWINRSPFKDCIKKKGEITVKEVIEEYGGIIAAGLGGAVIIGILALIIVPGSPINKLLVAVMP